MSYLSKLLTRSNFHHALPTASKYFFTNFANTPRKLVFRPAQLSISPFTTVRIRAIKQEELIEPNLMEHDKYNACLGRPLSPHIRIYKKQLTSLLSFGHRLTGLMMLFYVYVVTAGTWLWTDITSFFDYLESLDSILGEYWWTAAHRTVKFLVAYPFCYHSLNAIRHLSWDAGRLLGMRQIYRSGYIMQAMVIVLALFFSLLVPLDLSPAEEEAETEIDAAAIAGDAEPKLAKDEKEKEKEIEKEKPAEPKDEKEPPKKA